MAKVDRDVGVTAVEGGKSAAFNDASGRTQDQCLM